MNTMYKCKDCRCKFMIYKNKDNYWYGSEEVHCPLCREEVEEIE